MGKYQMSERSAEDAQRKLQNANCGSFNCDTSAAQAELNAANEAESNEQVVLNRDVAKCQKASDAIKAARGQEKSAGLLSVQSGSPSCPNGVDGGSAAARKAPPCGSASASVSRRI